MEEKRPMTPSERARLGGLAVSYNREHMAEIGRKGGLKVSQDRAHMSEIGRRGGRRVQQHGNLAYPASPEWEGTVSDGGS